MSKKLSLSLTQEFELRRMMDAARTGNKEQILELLESSLRHNFELKNHFITSVMSLEKEIQELTSSKV